MIDVKAMASLRRIIFLFQQLFDTKATRLNHGTRSLLNIIYLMIGVIIWLGMVRAKYEVYDENIGSMLGAFSFSVLAFIILFILVVKRRHWLKDNVYGTAIFFITCSPLTVAIVVLNYAAIFGQIDNG